jgi:hypothetical protein
MKPRKCLTIPLIGQCFVSKNSTFGTRRFAIISELEFFEDAMNDYGGNPGQKYKFHPRELMAR